MGKKIVIVEASKLHPSSVIPLRSHGNEIIDSVKNSGIQQVLIARPLLDRPGELEIIDGLGRYNSLRPTDKVVVEVRENTSDADAFRISDATFKRTERTAYEIAVFYAHYIEAVKKEIGEKGAYSRVAKESQISESLLSQYLGINQLFTRLTQLSPTSKFYKLKTLGINKLYELSTIDDDANLLNIATMVELNADLISTEEIQKMVQETKYAQFRIVEELGTTEENPQQEGVAQSTASEAEPNEEKLETASGVGAKFQEALAKVSWTLQEVGATVSQVSTRGIPEPMSSEVVITLKRIDAAARRLLGYVNRLEELAPK